MAISTEEQLLLDDDALLGVDWDGNASKSYSSVSVDSDEEDYLLGDSSTSTPSTKTKSFLQEKIKHDDENVLCNGQLDMPSTEESHSYNECKDSVRRNNDCSKIVTRPIYRKSVNQQETNSKPPFNQNKHVDYQDFSFTTRNSCLILPSVRSKPCKSLSTHNHRSLGYNTKLSVASSAEHCDRQLLFGGQGTLADEDVSGIKTVPKENIVCNAMEERRGRKIIKLNGSKKFHYIPSGLEVPPSQIQSRKTDRRIKRLHF